MTLNALSDAGNAILKSFVPKSVHDGIFGTSANSKSSPQSGTQPLSSEQPRAIISPRTYGRRMTSAHYKSQIHKEIFHGTSQYDPIEVEVDDDVEEIPAQANKETDSATQQGFQPAKPAKTPEDKRRKSRISSEEARTLGYRENIPADAVPIEIPSSKPEMSFEQKNKRFSTSSPALSGGLKPMNTMNSHGKQQYQYDITRKQFTPRSTPHSSRVDAAQEVQRQTRSTPVRQAHVVNTPPTKKRKLDSPTKNHLRDVDGRNLTSETSQGGGRNNSVVQLDSDADDLALLYDFEKPRPQASRPTSNGVKHTPLRELATGDKGPQESSIHEPREDSIDDLTDPSDFMKDATKQRKSGIFDSDDDQAYPRRTVHNQLAAQKQHQTRTLLAPITPPAPKVAPGYYEKSPDELNTVSETSKSHRKPRRQLLSPNDHSLQPGVRFPLRAFVCRGFIDVPSYDLEVFEHQKTFAVHYRAATMEDALTPEIPLTKITQLFLPETEEKNCVMLRLSAGSLPSNTCFLEFETTKALYDFSVLVQNLDPTLQVHQKSCQWVENAMGKSYANNRDMSDAQRAKYQNEVRQNEQMRVGRQAAVSAAGQSSGRKRLKDHLDAPSDHANGQNGMHRSNQPAASHQERNDAQALSDAARDVSTSKVRQTRSRALEQHVDDAASHPRPINIDPRRQGPEWKRPLMYPREGPRRESVTWDDLSRLEDDEYLNDSLVALFIRYLQENMDQEELKKMHFFNTFFYETLMRPSGAKGGRRQINYKGVANWTKNIRLFKRDYVIVPVNENAHWYVMMICNLRSLLGEDKDASEETGEQPFAQPPVGTTEDNDSPQILSEHEALPPDFVNESTVTAEATELASETPDKRRPGRPKKAHRQLPKYAIDQPVIITLDSLNSGRSPTATALKDYLAEEAKEKVDLDIDRASIRGMTAKNIPLQGNFSDCGLYMCMYLEQFVREPRRFVSSLLQRDTEAMQWPKKLRSEALRQRLYDMLQELHMAQHKKEKANVQPIGRILIRDEDLLSDKQEYVKGGLAFYESYSQNRSTQSAECTDSEEASTSEGQPVVQGGRAEHRSPGTIKAESETDVNAIVIDDDSQVQPAPQDGKTSRFFAGTAAESAQGVSQAEDTPQRLAARLKQQRSPERLMQRSSPDMQNRHRSPREVSKTSSTLIDLSTPIQEQPALRQRSVSVSTDFLSGNASYDTNRKQTNADDGVDRQKEVYNARYEEEGVFEGFDDDHATAGHQEGRHGSVVPESNYGDETATDGVIQVDEATAADEMLLE